jgi:hypothetical protein
MQARLEGIGHLLRDRLLGVPKYQRPYAWSAEQVQQFIADLQAALGSIEPTYFLGTIVLTDTKGDRLTVVDGQQRLATVVLLFAAIANEFIEAGDGSRGSVIDGQYVSSRSLETDSLRPRLELNEEDQPLFEALIYRRWADVEGDRPSHRRLIAAYEVIRTAVRAEVERAGPHWQDALFRWVTFIDDQVQVIVVVADNDSDAFLLFETLNDRGKDLTVVDLLKNHLFGLARTTLPSVERPWVEAIEVLDFDEDQAMTTFIRHYWSSTAGATRERELYRSLKRNIRTAEQAADFTEGLARAAFEYAALLDPRHEYWSALDLVEQNAVAITLSFGLEQNRPLLLAAMDSMPFPELGRLMRAIVSWTVRGLVTGGIGGGTAETYYANAAVQIRRGSLRSVEAILEALTPIVPNDDEFVAAFRSASVYRIKTSVYLLLALERAASGGDEVAYPSPDERQQYIAQAIVPRGADPHDWPGWSSGTISAFGRRLGNFALLPAGSRLEGPTWSERRQGLAASGLGTSERAALVDLWTPDELAERQDEFATHVASIWPLMP